MRSVDAVGLDDTNRLLVWVTQVVSDLRVRFAALNIHFVDEQIEKDRQAANEKLAKEKAEEERQGTSF